MALNYIEAKVVSVMSKVTQVQQGCTGRIQTSYVYTWNGIQCSIVKCLQAGTSYYVMFVRYKDVCFQHNTALLGKTHHALSVEYSTVPHVQANVFSPN